MKRGKKHFNVTAILLSVVLIIFMIIPAGSLFASTTYTDSSTYVSFSAIVEDTGPGNTTTVTLRFEQILQGSGNYWYNLANYNYEVRFYTLNSPVNPTYQGEVPTSPVTAWTTVRTDVPANEGTGYTANLKIIGKYSPHTVYEDLTVSFYVPEYVAPDTEAPTGSITINSNDTYTTSTSVTLNLSATDNVGVTGYRVANGSDASGAAEVPVTSTLSYSDDISWVLGSGDGIKTVAVQYCDADGNWSPNYTDTIKLDATPPTGTLLINGGAALTNITNVTLSLNAGDGNDVSGYRIANGTDASGGTIVDISPAVHPFSASVPWILDSGDGLKTVAVQYRDIPGNWSDNITATITLETPTTHTVTFDAQGGTPDGQTRTVAHGGTIDPLPTVTKAGNNFVEWFTANSGGEYDAEFTTSTQVTEDITVYALWEEETPDLSITVTGPATAEVGETITYTITIVNNTGGYVSDVKVFDDQMDLVRNVGGASWITYTFPKNYEIKWWDEGSLTYTVSVYSGSGSTFTLWDTDSHTVTVNAAPAPAISITKSASSTSANPDDTITYTITVENTGNVDLTNVTVADMMLGLNQNLGVMMPGATATLNRTYLVQVGNIGTLTNFASVNASYGTQTITDSDTASVEVSAADTPAISITKTASPTTVTVGDEITYTYTITNTGNVRLGPVRLVDDKLGNIDLPIIALDPTMHVTVTETYVAQEGDIPEITNIATASGWCEPANDNGSLLAFASFANGGACATATDSVTVIVTAPDEEEENGTATTTTTTTNTKTKVKEEPAVEVLAEIEVLAYTGFDWMYPFMGLGMVLAGSGLMLLLRKKRRTSA
jgi:hypothetical protein